MENLDEGTVFFEKNSEKKTPAAAFVKILASIVALEKWGNLDGTVKVTKENLSLIDYEYGVRVANYKEGEVISKRELFDCLVVYSANDAVSIIAHEISGSLDGFIKEMQDLCTKIGCSSTVIKNITGFDAEGQYTTAGDVAKIIKYALNYPIFSEAFSAKTVTLKATEQNEERTYNASNRMTNAAIPDYYHSSVTGGKQTGTDEAGECIAVVSNKDGYSYLTVVMGGKLMNIDSDDSDENTCMTDAKKMLSWVYENIRYRVIVSPTQTVKRTDIVAGKGTDSLRLVPEKEVSALVPSKASPASVMFEVVDSTMPKTIVAPVKAGDIIAQAKVYYAGQELTTINLVAANDVKLSFVGLVMSGIRAVVGSTVFLVISLILAVAAVAVFIFNFLEYQKKQKGGPEKKVNKNQGTAKKTVKNSSQAGSRKTASQKTAVPSTKSAQKGRGTLASYQSNSKNGSDTGK
ncbi:MAG: D-alanyl-D-alanine carboxypeptidase [Clostridia bacterium]|nr:D-alanyl-D-alanine carboxypeptidase [Clostridia bacterium]